MKNMLFPTLLSALAIGFCAPLFGEKLMEEIPISEVWSGHSVNFCLLTEGDRQYAGYYDQDRNLVVASRRLTEKKWTKKVLPTKVGWDSHNFITMAVDGNGDLHVSGNMHVVPLIYFRTTVPGDVTTLRTFPMTGKDEERCTYPNFFFDKDGNLLFHYRIGRSGRGDEIYNIYDRKTHTWRRLLDTPLSDGENKASAYFSGPTAGPDGYIHLLWMWRSDYACETNHDLNYARSKDMVHWESVRGEAVPLPFRPGDPKLLIFSTEPTGSGLINNCFSLRFDGQKRPLVFCHKYDAEGKSQIFVSRFEKSAWLTRPVTNWDQRWDFSAGGTVVKMVNIGALAILPNGNPEISVSSKWSKGQCIELDAATLKPVTVRKQKSAGPRPAYRKIRGDFPGLELHLLPGRGTAGPNGEKYYLRWETLGPHRDKPRKGPLPEPSELTLCVIKE